MSIPITKKLSEDKLGKISIKEIIYAEFAEGGAMGNAGGSIFYIIENEDVICYETNLSNNADLYLEIREALIQHQNVLKYDNIEKKELIFDYHYGGMGNHVFINKNISLNKEKDYFVYQTGKNSYAIYCSVLGVFDYVVNSIDNSSNK